MRKNNYLYILVKDNPSIIKTEEPVFKIGFTTNLEQTVDYYYPILKYRESWSFVFQGEYKEMIHLLELFESLFYKYKLNLDIDNVYNIKALPLLKEFTDSLKKYKINSKKISLNKALVYCKPKTRTFSRAVKSELLFDFSSMSKEELEYKYEIDYDILEKTVNSFLKIIHEPYRKSFEYYLSMRRELNKLEKKVRKIIY